MRYELYTHTISDNASIYDFSRESNNITALCNYIENYPQVNTDFQWIIIDNEPTTFNLHNLGFAEMPTREELKKRIAECKYFKYFKYCGKTFDEMVKFYDAHKDEYYRKSEAEAEEIVNKLYQYEPIITNTTLQYRSAKKKYRLVRELLTLKRNRG